MGWNSVLIDSLVDWDSIDVINDLVRTMTQVELWQNYVNYVLMMIVKIMIILATTINATTIMIV